MEIKTSHPTDAAQFQNSDYSGVSTADLMELRDALNNLPHGFARMAVLGRLNAELRNRGE